MYDPGQNSVVITEMPDINMDQQMNYADIIEKFLNESDVTFSGMETIDGRDTFIMILEPKEEVTSNAIFTGNLKVWVDEETWLPLKYDMYDNEGNVIVAEIPEGAEVSTINLNEFAVPENITLEEAKNKADFGLLLPSYIPEGYEFDHASFLDYSELPSASQVQRVTFVYTNGNSGLRITEVFYEDGFPGPTEFSDSEIVDFNGHSGDLVEIYGDYLLRWDVNGVELTITGPLDKDEILTIAGSMN
jgi:hypothetical protein